MSGDAGDYWTYRDGQRVAMTAAEIADLQAWRATMPAVPVIRTIRTLAWLRRLDPARWAAINVAAVQAAAAGNGALFAAIQQLTASTDVNMDDPQVTGGIAAWVAAGLLTADDQTALLRDGTLDET